MKGDTLSHFVEFCFGLDCRSGEIQKKIDKWLGQSKATVQCFTVTPVRDKLACTILYTRTASGPVSLFVEFRFGLDCRSGKIQKKIDKWLTDHQATVQCHTVTQVLDKLVYSIFYTR